MVSPTFVASLVTIVPSMAMLWYLLKRYEDYFDDARVFFSLIVGFFGGLFIMALETLVFGFDRPSFQAAAGVGTAFIMYVFGYSVLETAAKVVVLGSRGYRTRRDTPYYGAALGLGMGAILGLLFVALNLEQSGLLTRSIDGEWLQAFLLIAMLPMGAAFAHGATGVWVGYYTSQGRLWYALAIGALLQMPILGMYWLWPTGGSGVALFPAVASVIYGSTLVAITINRILENVVPPEIRDQVRRDRRRQQRLGTAAKAKPQWSADAAKETGATTSDAGPAAMADVKGSLVRLDGDMVQVRDADAPTPSPDAAHLPEGDAEPETPSGDDKAKDR